LRERDDYLIWENERRPDGYRRSLVAIVGDAGELTIVGHDRTPGGPIEVYDWEEIIPAKEIPKLLGLLGADPRAHILDVIEESWMDRYIEVKAIIHENGIETFLWIEN